MALSNIDILELLKKNNVSVNDIIMKDCEGSLKKGFYIVNLDNAGGGGTHWTALYFDGKLNIYFDSFGVAPPKNIERLLGNFIYNTEQIQDLNSELCGYYCVLFVKYLYHSRSKYYRFNEFVNLFYLPERNEEILKKLFKLQ